MKALLIYLVIYGHWIEPAAEESWVYRLIYLIHMPLFAFLTGLFLRREGDCLRQIKRLLPIYLGLQGIAAVLGWPILVPFWHLWYLLSCCAWAGAGWLWLRFGKGRGRWVILASSVLLGVGAGFVPWLGRTLSGSRTVVFFPFFWAGLISSPDIPWRKYRPWALAALPAGLAGFLLWGLQMEPRFLTQADPYRSGGEAGLRLAFYGISTLPGFFLLAFTPQRRLPVSRLGADTLMPYLLHAPLVALLREFWPRGVLGSALVLIFIHSLTQWHSPLRGIVSGERRDGLWPNSIKSTSNTPGRCTDSS